MSLLDVTLITGVLAMTLRMATPLIYGTIGENFSERAGILNLGIEGHDANGSKCRFPGRLPVR